MVRPVRRHVESVVLSAGSSRSGARPASEAPIRFRARAALERPRRNTPRPIFVVATRLVQLWTSTQRELAELGTLRARMERTRAYLASPGSNPLLGQAYLQRMGAAYRTGLDRLRAHQEEARSLLSRLNSQSGHEMLSGATNAPGPFSDRCNPAAMTPPRHCWYA